MIEAIGIAMDGVIGMVVILALVILARSVIYEIVRFAISIVRKSIRRLR